MAERSRTRSDRPAKPYPDFPLFPHATRRWAKKIRGRFAFFGPWEDPQGALERYLAQRDHLFAGVTPPAPSRRRAAPPRGAGRPTTPDVGPEGDDGESDGQLGAAAATGRTVGESGRNGQGSTPGRASKTVIGAGTAGTGEGLELRDLVNHFLTAKQRRVDAGDMGLRSFSEYHATAGRLIAFLGKHHSVAELTADDFGRLRAHLAQVRGPVALGNEIGRVRSIFKHGFEANLMDKPVRYGPEFRKPAKRAVRLARKASGLRMYEAAEIQALLEAAGPQLRAMILLGVNCGMGNTDVAALTRSVVNLKTRVVEFPRPKTGIARRAVLWPETVAALRALQKTRPAPKQPQDADLVFVTRFGQPWVRVTKPGARSKGKHQAVVKDSVAMEFRKVARAAGVDKDRRGFYALRHTFRTIADEVGDRRAVDLVMGHENGADIANHYVERIGDDRLEAVAEHVRAWLGLGRDL